MQSRILDANVCVNHWTDSDAHEHVFRLWMQTAESMKLMHLIGAHVIAIVMHLLCWFNLSFSLYPSPSPSSIPAAFVGLNSKIRRCRIVCVIIVAVDGVLSLSPGSIRTDFSSMSLNVVRTNAWIWALIMFNVSIYSLNAYCYWLWSSHRHAAAVSPLHEPCRCIWISTFAAHSRFAWIPW